MTEVLEGWDIREPQHRRPRSPLLGPWRFVGEPAPWCRCGHAAEMHLHWGCQDKPCSCEALVAVGVLREQVRTVIDYALEAS